MGAAVVLRSMARGDGVQDVGVAVVRPEHHFLRLRLERPWMLLMTFEDEPKAQGLRWCLSSTWNTGVESKEWRLLIIAAICTTPLIHV